MLGKPRTDAESYAAHLEGLAYVERLAYEVVQGLGAEVGDTICVAGGAAQSQAGLQIRADVLDKRLQVPEVPLGAMGAAILAARACGHGWVADAARAMVRVKDRVQPREQHRQAYLERYQRFLSACRDRGYLS